MDFNAKIKIIEDKIAALEKRLNENPPLELELVLRNQITSENNVLVELYRTRREQATTSASSGNQLANRSISPIHQQPSNNQMLLPSSPNQSSSPNMSSDSMKNLIGELNENMPQTQINETLIKTIKELLNKPKK